MADFEAGGWQLQNIRTHRRALGQSRDFAYPFSTICAADSSNQAAGLPTVLSPWRSPTTPKCRPQQNKGSTGTPRAQRKPPRRIRSESRTRLPTNRSISGSCARHSAQLLEIAETASEEEHIEHESANPALHRDLKIGDMNFSPNADIVLRSFPFRSREDSAQFPGDSRPLTAGVVRKSRRRSRQSSVSRLFPDMAKKRSFTRPPAASPTTNATTAAAAMR